MPHSDATSNIYFNTIKTRCQAAGRTLFLFFSAPWRRGWGLAERFAELPERWQALAVLGGLAVGLAALYRPLPLPAALGILLLLGLLTLLRLDMALCVAAFVLPLYPQPAAIAGRQFSLFEIMILLSLVAGLLRGLRRLTRPPRPSFAAWFARHRRELLPPLAFLAVCSGSLLWSTDPAFITADGTGLLRISLREYRVTIVEPLLLYPLLLGAFRGRRERAWWMVDALVLSAALVALGGIIQVLTPGMHAEVADGVRRATSVYGTFSANTLALFLGRVAALAIPGALFLPWGRRRILYLLSVGPIGAGLALTYSRGSYMAIAAVLLLYGLLRSRLLLLAEAGLGAGGLLLAWATGKMGRLLALDTWSNRLSMWRNAWVLVRERPVAGWGLDAYYHYYRQRFPGQEATWNPNNGLLEFWSRIGLLGLAAAAWLYGTLLARAWRVYRRTEAPTVRILALALLGSVVYALGHSLLDALFFAPDWAATFWIAYGLTALLAVSE